MVDTVLIGGSGQRSHGHQVLDTLGFPNLSGVNKLDLMRLNAQCKHFLHARQMDLLEIALTWPEDHD